MDPTDFVDLSPERGAPMALETHISVVIMPGQRIFRFLGTALTDYRPGLEGPLYPTRRVVLGAFCS